MKKKCKDNLYMISMKKYNNLYSFSDENIYSYKEYMKYMKYIKYCCLKIICQE